MQTSCGARQERHTQFTLQHANLMADDRLGHSQPIPGGCEGAGFEDRGEIDQAIQVEKVAHVNCPIRSYS